MRLSELVDRLNFEDLSFKVALSIIKGYGFLVVGDCLSRDHTQKYIICKEKPTSRKEYLVKFQ